MDTREGAILQSIGRARLKECPFCGCEDVNAHGRKSVVFGFVVYWIECYECGARTREYPTMEDAGNAWNRRAE